MSRDWKMGLYFSLPVVLQELALSAYACHLDRLYYGPVYEQTLLEIGRRRFDGPEAVEAWQTARLAATVAEARRYVPYYRRILADHGPINDAQALAAIPLLGKQQIRQHEPEFIDERFDRRALHTEKTSGTTGTSVSIFWDKPSLQKMWAANEVRVRQVAGVGRLMPRAMLGGRPILPGGTRRPPFWRYNRRWQQLYLSSYHISRQWCREYVEAIRRAGSVWLTGYGSAIGALAESALAEAVPPLRLKAVVVSGDTLQPRMREVIEAFFECRCYDHYGQSEGVCWVMQCPHGRMHVVPEFGLLEILDEAGQPCRPGVVGEMVVTGFINKAMPLIRYRTGDEAAWAANQQCACGQPFPIVERLEGRVDDYLVTADGRRIGRLSTAVKGSPSIHSAQIVQDRPGHAYLLVKPGNNYRRVDGQVVRGDILKRIGTFGIDVMEVDDIPRTRAGKLKLVVRLADKPELRADYSGILPTDHRLATTHGRNANG